MLGATLFSFKNFKHHESQLNRLICGRSKISLELCVALVTCTVVMHNRKKRGLMQPLLDESLEILDKLALKNTKTSKHCLPSGLSSVTMPPPAERTDSVDFDRLVNNVKKLTAIHASFKSDLLTFDPLQVLLSSPSQEDSTPTESCNQSLFHNLRDFGQTLKQTNPLSAETEAIHFQFTHFATNTNLSTTESANLTMCKNAVDIVEATGCVTLKFISNPLCPLKCYIPKEIKQEKVLVIANSVEGFHVTEALPAKPEAIETVRNTCTCGSGRASSNPICVTKRCKCHATGKSCLHCSCVPTQCKNVNGARGANKTKIEVCRCGLGAGSKLRAVNCNWGKCKCFRFGFSCNDSPRYYCYK